MCVCDLDTAIPCAKTAGLGTQSTNANAPAHTVAILFHPKIEKRIGHIRYVKGRSYGIWLSLLARNCQGHTNVLCV